MKKWLKLINIKAWGETFVLKFLASKAAKHFATVLAGVVAGIAAKNKLDQYGIVIDVPHFTEALMTLFGAAAGALLNWTIKVLDKDGDGFIG